MAQALVGRISSNARVLGAKVFSAAFIIIVFSLSDEAVVMTPCQTALFVPGVKSKRGSWGDLPY
ncbi:hypothetical protein D3C84_1313930 [compost metagenome]